MATIKNGNGLKKFAKDIAAEVKEGRKMAAAVKAPAVPKKTKK